MLPLFSPRLHKFPAFLGGVFLVLALGAEAGEGSGSGQPLTVTATQLRALGVETLVPGNGNAAEGGRQSGWPAKVLVPAAQMRVVASPLAGMVEMLAVAPGEKVRRGQVLARLSSTEALAWQREGIQAESQAALLVQARQRDEQLFAEGLIPESRVQASRAAAQQAEAAASERRQALRLAGLADRGTPGGKAGKTEGGLALVAPIDGVVLEQNAQLGQRIEPSVPVFRIARLSPLWLEIQAPLSMAGTLREGAAVKVRDKAVTGRITAIVRNVDTTSQTVLLRASVGQEQGAALLTPGQMLEVAVEGGEASGSQRLPAAALFRNEGSTWVFVASGEGDKRRFTPVPVRILAQSGDMATVEGIKPGDPVVVRGVSALKAMLTGVGRE